MPMKPIKYGFKMYSLAEAVSGYMLNFVFHGSKEMENLTETPEDNPFLESLVLGMCKNYGNKGFHIYMDRFYTSCPLFEKLKENGIKATGTIKTNRKGLPNFDTKNMNDYEASFLFSSMLNYCI